LSTHLFVIVAVIAGKEC